MMADSVTLSKTHFPYCLCVDTSYLSRVPVMRDKSVIKQMDKYSSVSFNVKAVIHGKHPKTIILLMIFLFFFSISVFIPTFYCQFLIRFYSFRAFILTWRHTRQFPICHSLMIFCLGSAVSSNVPASSQYEHLIYLSHNNRY